LRRKKPCSSSIITKNGDDVITKSNCNTHSSDVNTHSSDVNTHSSDVNTHSSDVNTHSSDVNTHSSDVNIEFSLTKDAKDEPNVINQCVDCNKIFKLPIYLKAHYKKCKGNPLMCKTCSRIFNSRQAKSIHIKRGKCVKADDSSNDNTQGNNEPNTKYTNNNTQINILNGSHNNVNNTTNNININVFGKEDLDYLFSDGNLMQKLKAHGKNGVYGFSDIIKDIHCNRNRPENNTIIKPLDYGDGVFIMGEHKQWMYREFEDVRPDLLEIVARYVEICAAVKAELNIRLSDKNEKRIIQRCVHKLIAMRGGSFSDEFEDELEIDDAEIQKYENESKHLLRKFDRATMCNLNEYTNTNYKKDKGTYVLK
jgi:outer membrane murein-binding lipoprotein Lpp